MPSHQSNSYHNSTAQTLAFCRPAWDNRNGLLRSNPPPYCNP